MQAFLHGALDAARGDAVLFVVGDLAGAAVLGDGHERLHAFCLGVGEAIDLAVHVTRGAAGGLDEGGLAAEVAFLVGVEDADERDLGQIEAFAEQVDADQHVELRGAQGAEDFHALDGVDVAVEVADLQAHVFEVIAEVFGSAFGQRSDQDALVFFHALAAEFEGVVDLVLEREDGDARVEQAGRADDLFDDERRAAGRHIEAFDRRIGAGKFRR